ncbi:hypothetical protein I317_00329 [Kwoniella heveanensis CBS 569]|nr:hypothetical protein I317_00329 [Kwoniella heveanensis CBS 569]
MSFTFGASSSAAKPAFGGFTTPNPSGSAPAPGGSLFGSAPQNPANPSTSLFGSTTNQQSQPAASSSGLFGSTTGQPAGTTTGGGGLFGSTVGQGQQQQGQAQPSGGLFGSTTQAGQTGGGLFGQQQQQQPAGQASGGGLFGSSTQNTAGGSGLFGQQNAAKPAGSGLFGSTTTQPAAGGSGLFGASATQPSTGGGLFGSTNPQQNQAQQPQQAGSSLFGGGFGQQSQAAKPAGSLFGNFGASTSQPQQLQQQQPQQQPNSLFGSTNAGFGQQSMNNNNAMMGSTMGVGASTSVIPNPFGVKQEVDIETRIKMVQNAWDTNSPDCRFKYFFYNVVEEGTTGRYGRPAGANDDAKWVKALRDNPDPNCMVPVLATGWADVKKRQQAQENLASVHQQRIKELTQALSHTRQTSLSASIRLANLQAQQTQLLHRLIHLVAQTPQFVPLIQSTAFRQEEAEMQAQLEGVKAELEGKGKNSVRSSSSIGLNNGSSNSGRGTPVGIQKGRLLGQVNELWGQLEEIRRRRKVRSAEGTDGSWLGDEKALAEVAEILATQQMALQKLSGLVHDAVFDADVMRQGLGMISTSDR